MKNVFTAVLALALAACASISKIEPGERTVGERLVVNLDGSWNQINAPGLGPAAVWTMEGLPVDQLLIFSGIQDGQAIHAPRSGNAKTFNFRAAMQADEIEALFEGMLTQDGSRFRLHKLEPLAFGGGRGFRFEYDLIRKVDGVQLGGIGYGRVSKGQLFAMLYMAPRLAFFPRHVPSVMKIAESARVKE